MLRLNLAVNRYAFHWAYPEILADELGLFGKEGIQVEWQDATPRGVVSKMTLYKDLLTAGSTDVYHAGDWACINRVLGAPDSFIVAKSRPGMGTLNSSFSIFVRKDSPVKEPADLAGKPVAVEEGTGAQYTTILDLDAYVEGSSIVLAQVGEPHRRLLALLRGEVEAASLLGPWAEIATTMGLRKVLQTSRSTPTGIVVRRDESRELLSGYFKAVNGAIRMLDKEPSRFRKSYFACVKEVLDELPSEVNACLGELEATLDVPLWNVWEAYGESDFRATYSWMVRRGLAEGGHHAAEVVDPHAELLFA